MPRHPARLPAVLSGRTASASTTLFSVRGQEVDVAIGGIAFRLATTTELPQTYETIPVRKDQLDTELDPGEQSLSGWWRRSQDSWHEGAGNLYQESRGDVRASSGFYTSQGVNVWTRGSLTLLRRMVSHATTTYKQVRTYTDAGVQRISAISDPSLSTFATPSSAAVALHSPAGKTMVDGFVAGANFYDLASDGTLYDGTVASPATATTWPLGADPKRLAFGKHRLWACGGRKIWQPDLALAGGTAQNPIFTNPNKGWTYTCIAEGPGAMYFGGHDGRSSSIQAIALDANGGVPTLTGAQLTAQMPQGELVQEIEVLAGQFLGIGTNKGFRVGVIDTNNIAYGPLLFEGVTGCTAITTMDRFFLVAFSTASGAVTYRVDTGTQLADGIFPYARDVDCTSATSITGLAVYDTQVLAASNGGTYWYQHATEFVASGELRTGRARFRTSEKKLWKFLEMEGLFESGSVAILSSSDDATDLSVATVSGGVGSGSLGLPAPVGAQRYLALKFTLNRDTVSASLGPTLNSYLVKALPSVAPQRLITLPLLCHDYEQARSGHRYGYNGFCEDRLEALQVLEDIGDTLTYQDFTKRWATGQTVLVENMRFVQTAPGHHSSGKSSQGGVLVLQLRTVGT